MLDEHPSISGVKTPHQDTSKGVFEGETPGCFYIAEGDLGLGLFARILVKEGDVILKFSGPRIGFAEAVAKGDRQCYPLQISRQHYIDLEAPGCFSNHSCSPNAGIRNDSELIAIKDIYPGQEIRYDYSTTMDEDFYTMPCRCGVSNCRGEVTDFKFLPETIRANYLKNGIVMEFIAAQYRGDLNSFLSRPPFRCTEAPAVLEL